MPVFLRQRNTLPLAEGRRVASNIYGHVKDCPAHHLDQLGLRLGRFLEMQSSQHTAHRVRKVVLHEHIF